MLNLQNSRKKDLFCVLTAALFTPFFEFASFVHTHQPAKRRHWLFFGLFPVVFFSVDSFPSEFKQVPPLLHTPPGHHHLFSKPSFPNDTTGVFFCFPPAPLILHNPWLIPPTADFLLAIFLCYCLIHKTETIFHAQFCGMLFFLL